MSIRFQPRTLGIPVRGADLPVDKLLFRCNEFLVSTVYDNEEIELGQPLPELQVCKIDINGGNGGMKSRPPELGSQAVIPDSRLPLVNPVNGKQYTANTKRCGYLVSERIRCNMRMYEGCGVTAGHGKFGFVLHTHIQPNGDEVVTCCFDLARQDVTRTFINRISPVPGEEIQFWSFRVATVDDVVRNI